MRRYWLVAIGGGIGSLLRFGISEWMGPMRVWAPLPVLITNASGCFIISFLNFISDTTWHLRWADDVFFFQPADLESDAQWQMGKRIYKCPCIDDPVPGIGSGWMGVGPAAFLAQRIQCDVYGAS
jgi:hypothetical protein